MTRRADLPPSLGPAFSVSDAGFAGVSASRLRAADLARPFWGSRLHSSEVGFAAKCAALASRLSSKAVFSYGTAAALLQIPLPSSLLNSSVLHVTVPAGMRAPSGSRVRGHQQDLPNSHIQTHHGLRITGPERTWCDLSLNLSIPELVAAGDFLIHWRSPLASLESLAACELSYPNSRRARARRLALARLCPLAESPRESLLRVLIIEAGFAAPYVNYEVFDSRGRLLARVDLAWPSHKIAVEYEGDQHRTDRRQWQRDLQRIEDLQNAGWRVIRVSADDLHNPARLFRSLRITLAR